MSNKELFKALYIKSGAKKGGVKWRVSNSDSKHLYLMLGVEDSNMLHNYNIIRNVINSIPEWSYNTAFRDTFNGNPVWRIVVDGAFSWNDEFIYD